MCSHCWKVKRQQDDKDTKLIEAAKEGRAHAVEDLLENGAEVNCQDLGVIDEPLMYVYMIESLLAVVCCCILFF